MSLPCNSPNISSLPTEHEESFRRALSNISATSLAERAYAQILDGLPTEQSLKESYPRMEGHPVYEIPHTEICEGYLEKARKFRAAFDPSQLHFEPALLQAYSKTDVGSSSFHLRLIELVAVACHQTASHLYELDDGAHKHQLYYDWRETELQKVQEGTHRRYYLIPPAPFFQSAYQWPDRYPRGITDVVGYWAEGKIFGGVVVFDRGEGEEECNAMWIHGDLRNGPRTLYPPTQEQYDALIGFLLAGRDEDATCPLPIHGTSSNRPRWDPYEALANYHIFRDKYALRPPPPPAVDRGFCRRIRSGDWPEIGDQMFLIEQARAHHWGEPVDEAGVAAARARMNEVTPTSPCWRSFKYEE